MALAFAFSAPTESHAAVYGGVFDSRTGVYGFDGSHEFIVDDACLTNENGWYAVNSDKFVDEIASTYTKCGTASLTGLTLNVRRYASSVPSNIGYSTVVESATYTLSGIPDFGILGIVIADGELEGVDSDGVFGALGPGPTDTVGPGLYWWLKYESGQSPLLGGFSLGADPVFLSSSPCTDIGGSCSLTEYPDGATPTFERIPERIPEPGALALALAALTAMGGVGVAARRRHVTAPR